MRAISIERSQFAQTAVVTLATFAACALLGLMLAYWTWVWLGPSPERRAQAAAQIGGRVEAAYGLFGGTQRDGAAPARSGVTLLGVVAAAGSRSGYAILRLETKPTVAIAEGGEVEPGVRLAEVHADHVVLERGGVRETLAWPEKGSSAASTAPRINN